MAEQIAGTTPAPEFPLPPRRIDVHNHLWGDPDGSKLIEIMDRNSVDVTLLMGVPAGLFGAMNTDVPNEQTRKVFGKYPGRFVAGVYVDPRDADAIDTVGHYCSEGFRMVKLFPNLGYFPDDDAFIPFWDVVAELGMGVLSHCGWLGDCGPRMSQERWAAYYSHPGRFEKVIRTHPETPFIMAHMGGIAGYLEAVMLTTRTPNTYVDCTPGQGMLVLEKGGLMPGAVPAGKMLYGSDSYDVDGLLQRYHKIFIDQGYGASLEKVFYSNARGIFEKIGAMPAAPKVETATRPGAGV